MRNHLDDRDRELLKAPNFCDVATVRPDGTVHAIPVWCDVEGDHVLLNSAEGRYWPDNLRRTGQATLTVPNLENPYEYLTITGHLEEATHEGAEEHIHEMARKYKGADRYPLQPGEQRVLLRIAPDRVRRRSP
jgi:PPOX class probable F420-dependent enzyme